MNGVAIIFIRTKECKYDIIGVTWCNTRKMAIMKVQVLKMDVLICRMFCTCLLF